MKNKKPVQPNATKSFSSWAIYNWGIPWSRTFPTRSEAIKFVEEANGEPWSICKSYMQVKRVISTIALSPPTKQ